MDAAHAVLRRLRRWFLVWFIAEAVGGIAAAAWVLDAMSRHVLFRHAMGGVGASATIAAGVVVSLGLLALAWIVLDSLAALRPWARMVMLVIGWITVVSSAVNLLTLPASAALLESVVGVTDGDWAAVAAISVLTKIADIAFWGWVIYTLQMNPVVRHAFLGVRSQTQCLP